MNRLAALALAFALLMGPAHAQFDPFQLLNVGVAVDAGAIKAGDGIAYADGPRKKLDVYTPANPQGPAPVLFFIYGGGWKNGAREGYEFVGRAFAAQGFVVVIADYRLYPEVTYPAFLEDNAEALKWVEDNIATYGGDVQRLFLAGHSAGAYNAVMLGLDPSFLREFGVTVPIRAIAGISGPYDFYPFEYGEVINSFGSAPNPEGTQPVNLVTADAPPMLLASGTSDWIVRVQNTEHLAQRLKDQGVWVTEKYYTGFGHMEPVISIGAAWRWRMPVLSDMVEFFSRFGAFPGGIPYQVVIPELPEDQVVPMQAVITELEGLFGPLADGDAAVAATP